MFSFRKGDSSPNLKTQGECFDTDECAKGTHLCSDYADCHNTDGSYHCICQESYSKSFISHFRHFIFVSFDQSGYSDSADNSSPSSTELVSSGRGFICNDKDLGHSIPIL